ncbi:hypothetical protein QJS66_11410 [Kocuria rhizophila]|nr:hypothetical protein QJS66_11410 [Kocuria rhizophila]
MISYGASGRHPGDGPRRSEEAASSDQVLLVVEAADLQLKRQRRLGRPGMRGACCKSSSWTPPPVPTPCSRHLETISAQTMLPGAHCL